MTAQRGAVLFQNSAHHQLAPLHAVDVLCGSGAVSRVPDFWHRRDGATYKEDPLAFAAPEDPPFPRQEAVTPYRFATGLRVPYRFGTASTAATTAPAITPVRLRRMNLFSL